MVFNSLEETLERAEGFSSVFFGPLLPPRTRVLDPSISGLLVSSCRATQGAPVGGGDFTKWAGSGDATSPGLARLKALAEGIERYGSCLAPMRARVQSSSYDELSRCARVIDFEDYQLLRSEGVNTAPYRRARRNEVLKWVAGKELGIGDDKAETWFPLAFVSLSRHECFPFDRGTTSGFALGSTPKGAMASALCEVLERDAFVDAWWKKQSPAWFSLDQVKNRLDFELQRAVRHLSSRITIFDFTRKWGVPTFHAAIPGDPNRGEPWINLGGAAALDSTKALTRAVIECLRIFLSVKGRRALDREFQKIPQAPYETSIFHFDDLGALLFDPNLKDAYRFLYSGTRISDEALAGQFGAGTKEIEGFELEALVSRVRNAGGRVFAFDMTPADVAQAGFFLYRIVIPESIPLGCAHAARPWGCVALRDVPLERMNSLPPPFL